MAHNSGWRATRALGIACAALCVFPQRGARQPDAVRAIVDRAAKAFFAGHPQSVGMSVGVIYAGQRYTYNYGTIARGAHRLPTANTLYPIASVTKTFTSTLAAQASLEHKLSLEDDVRRYLDGVYPNLEFAGHPVRVVDLLDHRSGLPFILPDVPQAGAEYHDDSSPLMTRLDDIERHYTRADFYSDLHRVKLERIPGRDPAHYSNAGVQLAGYILERVYGASYESLLEAKILGPLGMRHTCISPECQPREDVAQGYDGNGNLMPNDAGVTQGAGALKTTVDDLLSYEDWQLAEQDPAVRLSHRPVLTSGEYEVGLNWQMWRVHKRRLVWQTGAMDGFRAYCVGLMPQKIGLVILANEADSTTSSALDAMANAILRGLDPRAIPLP